MNLEMLAGKLGLNTPGAHPLSGRRAVVTGGSKGIGLAVVAALLRDGAAVITAARRSTPELRDLAAVSKLTIVEADLSSKAGMERLQDHALEYGPVDTLINNVGGARATPSSGFIGMTDDDWLHTFQLNLMSAVRATRAFLPGMLELRRGAIVNISSVMAHAPNVRAPDYGAAKAALANLTKTLSDEFAPRGVRINTISPGAILTPSWEREGSTARTIADQTGTSFDEVLAGFPARMAVSLNRFGRAAEIAEVVSFLVSDRASYITGKDLIVDGGLLKSL